MNPEDVKFSYCKSNNYWYTSLQRWKKICPLLPEDEQCVIKGKIILEKDVFIGANAMIFPNVQIGEGAIIGSASLVTKDVGPWTINVGTPAKVIGIRPKVVKK